MNGDQEMGDLVQMKISIKQLRVISSWGHTAIIAIIASYQTHRCYRYINLPADRFAGVGLHPRLDITGGATLYNTW